MWGTVAKWMSKPSESDFQGLLEILLIFTGIQGSWKCHIKKYGFSRACRNPVYLSWKVRGPRHLMVDRTNGCRWKCLVFCMQSLIELYLIPKKSWLPPLAPNQLYDIFSRPTLKFCRLALFSQGLYSGSFRPFSFHSAIASVVAVSTCQVLTSGVVNMSGPPILGTKTYVNIWSCPSIYFWTLYFCFLKKDHFFSD